MGLLIRMVGKRMDNDFLLLFLNFEIWAKNSNPEKFANIIRIERHAIIAINDRFPDPFRYFSQLRISLPFYIPET